MTISVLDHGSVRLVESWGSDEGVIEAARMSTGKGFAGWGTPEKSGDEKLLRYLWTHRHTTPFETPGATFEVTAPIVVVWQWVRHRTMCLGPGTLIHFDAPKSRPNRRFVYKMRIEDVWRKWQPTILADRPQRQKNAFWPRSRIQGMKLRCLDESTGEVVHTRIVDVIRGEPRPMIRITTSGGRVLTATPEHRVYTDAGWMMLGDAISASVRVAVEGKSRGLATRWEAPPLDERCEMWAPVVGWGGVYDVSTEGRVRRVGHRPKKPTVGSHGYLVVNLSHGGRSRVTCIHSAVLEAFSGPRPVGGECRHKNHNRADARLCNLKWGTSADNSADQKAADRTARLVSSFDAIVRVEDAGTLPSFDLAVAGPWHNFIADGVVVHNSYNILSGRYTEMPTEDYVPSVVRCLADGGANRQAGRAAGADVIDEARARLWLASLKSLQDYAHRVYREGLAAGVPKELARLTLTFSRYTRMRVTANLWNWTRFLALRNAPDAQWEIREYAVAVQSLLAERFPRTISLFTEDRQT